MKSRLLICAIMVILGVTQVSHAASPVKGLGGGDKPIEIASDSLEILQETNKAIFTGHVVAIQGDTRLKADRMVVHYKQGNGQQTGQQGSVSKIDVDGNVFLATPNDTAKGQSGIYDVDKQEVQLFRNVVLTQGQNVLKGSQLTYDLNTGKSNVAGAKTTTEEGAAGSNDRVRMLLIPDKKEPGNAR